MNVFVKYNFVKGKKRKVGDNGEEVSSHICEVSAIPFNISICTLFL